MMMKNKKILQRKILTRNTSYYDNNNLIKNQKLYLDTSVPSAYYDEEKPERQELTKKFWVKLTDYTVYISDIVTRELKQINDRELRENTLNLVSGFRVLKLSNKEIVLGDKYIKHKIIPERVKDDAYHIAIASENNIDYLISWNFKHMVNVKTKIRVNAINALDGYGSIEIIAPPEL